MSNKPTMPQSKV